MPMTTITCILLLPFFGHAARDVIGDDIITTVGVLSDITIFLNWTDVVVVYDMTLRQEQSEALARLLAQHHIGTVMLYLPFPRSDVIASVTSLIHSTTMTSLILYLEPNSTEIFLKEASQTDGAHPHCQWLVMTSSKQSHVMEDFVCHPPCHVALLFDVTGDDINTTTLCRPSMHITTDVSRSVAHTGSSSGREEDTFVVCSFNAMTAMFDHVASWTQPSGLHVISDVIFPDFSRDFNGKKLRLGIWESLPFTRRLSTNGTVRYGGFCMVLLKEMARVLNFTYELVEPPDGQYGALEENGTWNGMVGMLVRGEIDMAVGPFSITPERKEVIDFTVPFMEDGGGILTKGGDPDPDLLNVFRPFPLSVWLLTCVAIVVTTGVFFFVNRVSSLPGLRPEGRAAPERVWTLEECLLAIYGSLMNQGVSRHPVRWCGRVVLGCWWLFTILMVSVYTASLAALLTVRLQAHNINSIHDLAAAPASSIQPLTIVGSSWWSLFTNARFGVYAAVGRRLEEGPVVRVNEDALRLVHQGVGAFIMDVNQIRYLYGQDCHRLHMAHTIFNSNGLGFALPQNAIFREAVNNVILKLHEGGFLDAWKGEWWKRSPSCAHDRPHVSLTTRLPLLSVGGVLILYGLVVLLSILCLLLQTAWHAARRFRRHPPCCCCRRVPASAPRGGGCVEKHVDTVD